jgi:hypothetical protein
LAAERTLFNRPSFFHSHSRVRMLRARLRCSGGSVTERGGGREGGREVVQWWCTQSALPPLHGVAGGTLLLQNGFNY